MTSDLGAGFEVETLENRSPIHKSVQHFHSCSTYEEFVSALYCVMDEIIFKLEETGDVGFESQKLEDGITKWICGMLHMVDIDANPVAVNGNTDLTVSQRRTGFKWICEAKVLRVSASMNHLYGGLCQHSTRYAVASSRQKHGGLIVYNYKDMTSKRVDEWKSYLLQNASNKHFEYFKDLKECEFRVGAENGFYTKHNHIKSGKEIIVRHFFVTMHHEPLK